MHLHPQRCGGDVARTLTVTVSLENGEKSEPILPP